ncbi:MAG: YebC/PmpR family DNA-binding transcriptional regulator [Candidatus Yanofskybacteria bacterium]|nr:YebC/PmpR family DNA-binding transcriptional regulator [Candidatus Yanofskybacteria bacterium]
MAGHSKWSQIKHKKAIADAKKGALFGKLSRAITIAARGNTDPATNSRLKAEIERARAVNMPLENIERAIRKTTEAADTLSELSLEFIGPGNAGVVVRAITDSSNRTINELRQIAASHNARLAGQGSVVWMFKKIGLIVLAAPATPDLQLRAIDAGADDVLDEDGVSVIYTSPEKLDAVRSVLGDIVASAEITLIPTTPAPISNEAERAAADAFVSALEDHDDVQAVYTTYERSFEYT